MLFSKSGHLRIYLAAEMKCSIESHLPIVPLDRRQEVNYDIFSHLFVSIDLLIITVKLIRRKIDWQNWIVSRYGKIFIH